MPKKKFQTEATISCKVSPGMFSTERGVLIELPDGRKISTFVDKRLVIVDREPDPNGEVEGRIKVSIVKDGKDSVVVDLPQPGLREGTRMIVPRGLLK